MSDLVVEQRIDAPPAVVYGYLTDSAKWRAWQGVDADHKPVAGGGFSMLMGNGMNARGQFVELIPHRRVVFTWGWVGHPGLPPGSSTVEIELRPDGDGTLLVLTHRSLPDDEVSPQQQGWRHYLPRLAAVAAGTPPGPDPGPAA
jgi:uncharacterized protein YndB with AHSA1/START domain